MLIRKCLVILFCVLCFTQQVSSQGMDFSWAERVCTVGWSSTAVDIAKDDSGNVFVTGNFRGTETFGTLPLTSAGESDMFLVKYDNSGNVLWMVSAGGADDDFGCEVATDGSGSVYVIGEFKGTAVFGTTSLTSAVNPDLFVVKYDAYGNFRWVKHITGTNNYKVAGGIATDGSGNVLATGSFAGTLIFGWLPFGAISLSSDGEKSDIFIVKYDSSGTIRWVERAGGTWYDMGLGVATDNGKNISITGYFTETASFGSISLTTSSGYTYYIAKYDSMGNALWAKKAEGAQNGQAVATDSSGNVVATGAFTGTASFGSTALTSAGNNDAFVVKYDASGNVLWAQHAGGSAGDGGRGIAVDSSGNVFATGSFTGSAWFGTILCSSAGESDIFVVQYDNDGNVLCAQSAGSTERDAGWGIVADHFGNIIVTGYYDGTALFGLYSVPCVGDEDIFLAKMKPPTVNVTFLVTVPSSTPAGDVIHIGGNFNDWDETGSSMTNTATDTWEITLPFTAGQHLEYKYHRGSWSMVERGWQNEKIQNRTFTVPGTDCVVNDTVASWADLVSVDTRPEGAITGFMLCSNYPNPFNPRTNIRFCLPQSSKVTLKVIDCLGREKAILVDGEMPAGVYEVPFENKTLDSGIFIYTLKAQDRDGNVVFQETKKGLMLK